MLQQLARNTPGAVEVRTGSKLEVLFFLKLFALRHPYLFLFWTKQLYKNRGRLFFYKAGLLARSLAAEMKARLTRAPLVLLDEGLLQRILSLFDRKLTSGEAARLTKRVLLPDLLIYGREGDFSRFTRAHDRGDSPRFRQGPEALEAWMQAVRANALLLREHLPAAASVRDLPPLPEREAWARELSARVV
jgi:hypothetical protein